MNKSVYHIVELGIYITKENIVREILTWLLFHRTLGCRQDRAKLQEMGVEWEVENNSLC